MKSSLRIVPRTKDMSDVSWLLNTRKYISMYDVLDIYREIYSNDPNGTPTTEEMVRVFETDDEKNIKTTVKIVSHYFDKSCVTKYMANDTTKSFGIALGIEYRMLKEIIDTADDSDIYLYLTEYQLNDEEINLIIEKNLVKSISDRVIDNNKVMYTTLSNNFEALIRAKSVDFIDSKFISRYIYHASFYNRNTLLQYILETYKLSHPLFESLDCLTWDLFTKSRRFSHWLEASKRIDDIAEYYIHIDSDDNVINDNIKYINNYLRLKSTIA